MDVGAWDGYFSFAAERLGTKRVLATDSYVWNKSTWGSKDGFNLARKTLESNVEDRNIDVLELSEEKLGGRFDVVFFLGVLYHMRDPMLALERVASVTSELLVVETLIDVTLTRRPKAAFYPGSSMDHDNTNWWGPNTSAMVAMLKETGFSSVKVVGRRLIPSTVLHIARNTAAIMVSRVSSKYERLPFKNQLTADRLVLHAYR